MPPEVVDSGRFSPTLRIGRGRLLAVMLLVPLAVPVPFHVYESLVAASGASPDLALTVRLYSVLRGAPYLLLFVIGAIVVTRRPVALRSRVERFYLLLSGVALAYVTAISAISIVRGNSPYYALGDLYRAVLTFVVLLVLVGCAAMLPAVRSAFLRAYRDVLIGIAVVSAVLKLGFAPFGHLYGPGILGFYMGEFVLAYLLFELFEGRRVPRRKWTLGLLLLFLVTASVLSMKRGAWLSMAVTTVLVLLVSAGRLKALGRVALVAAVFLGVAWGTGTLDPLVERYSQTFEGEYGVDPSTYVRVAEAAGALHTLGEGEPMAFLTGLGHGAQFRENPDVPMPVPGTGSARDLYHHIHITPALLLFRYGAIGALLFLALAGPTVPVAWRLRKREIRRRLLGSVEGRIFLATCIQVFVLCASGLKSNVFYGSPSFAAAATVIALGYRRVANTSADTDTDI